MVLNVFTNDEVRKWQLKKFRDEKSGCDDPRHQTNLGACHCHFMDGVEDLVICASVAQESKGLCDLRVCSSVLDINE